MQKLLTITVKVVIKQKFLFNLGRVDELKNDQSFVRLVEKLQKVFVSSKYERISSLLKDV